MSLFIQNLLQSLRNLRNTKWQTTVSVIGLVVGLVSLTLSANWLWSELNYDRFRPNYKELYKLCTTNDNREFPNMCYRNCGEVEEILKGTGVQAGTYRNPFKYKLGIPDTLKEERYFKLLELDSAMVSVLQLRPIVGTLEGIFADGDNIVLTHSLAVSLFGSPEQAIGKTVSSSKWNNTTYNKVVGVVEDCEKESNLYYDCLKKITIQGDWELEDNCGNFRILIRTSDKERFHTLLPQISRGGVTYPLLLRELSMAHKFSGTASFLELTFYPLAFVGISLLLLLSALVNLLISFTCIFLGRMREYALRRSLGASSWQNDLWMLTELLPMLVFAAMLAAVVLEWLQYSHFVPGFADHMFVTYGWVLLGSVGTLLMLLLYPIGKMRRAYRRSFSGSASSSASHAYLLVVQCFCCALLLFLSNGMQRQLSAMLGENLGFDTENILRLYTGFGNMYDDGEDELDYTSFVDELPDEFRKEAGAGITDAIFMPADIFNRVSNYLGIVVPEEVYTKELAETGGDRDKTIDYYKNFTERQKYQNFTFVEIPYKAFDFFRLKTEYGRGFSTEGLAVEEWPVMLNSKACEQLGLNFPNEDRLYLRQTTMQRNSWTDSRQGEYHFRDAALRMQDVLNVTLTDFHKEEEPAVFIGVPENHKCAMIQRDAVYIKHAPGRRADAEAAVRRILTDKFGVDPDKIRLHDMKSHIDYTYKEEIYYANLLTAVTLFSVFITFSGVLSLLLYSMRLRRRAMAIHRLMGAELRDVLRATLPPYLIYTLLGGILAYVPAVYFMRKWMEYFHYGSAPGVGFMALIIGGMLLVVFLLVLWQVRRAMNEKPVDVLRPEA